jgi:hypothetical protein
MCPPKLKFFQLLRDLQSAPKLNHGTMRCRDQWSANMNRKIEPGRLQLAVGGVEVIIQDVDSTAKGDLTINNTELPMQATPSHRNQQPPAAQRREKMPLHMGIDKPLLPPFGYVSCPHSVHHQKDITPSQGGSLQGRSNQFTRCVKAKNVSLQPYLMPACINGVHQRKKEVVPAYQQPDLVAGMKWCSGQRASSARSNSAINGK